MLYSLLFLCWDDSLFLLSFLIISPFTMRLQRCAFLRIVATHPKWHISEALGIYRSCRIISFSQSESIVWLHLWLDLPSSIEWFHQFYYAWSCSGAITYHKFRLSQAVIHASPDKIDWSYSASRFPPVRYTRSGTQQTGYSSSPPMHHPLLWSPGGGLWQGWCDE